MPIDLTRVAVLMPAWNAERYLEKFPGPLLQQGIKPEQVLIVDSESKDKTVERARSFGFRVHQIPRNEFNHGGTRRLASTLVPWADIWAYIAQEEIPIVPLYFAKERPVVRRNGQLLMIDDDRFPLQPGETPEMLSVRFRTLGCYPLTAAVESTAQTIDAIVAETLAARTSERHGRLIDHDQSASMEKKKQEGYF